MFWSSSIIANRRPFQGFWERNKMHWRVITMISLATNSRKRSEIWAGELSYCNCHRLLTKKYVRSCPMARRIRHRTCTFFDCLTMWQVLIVLIAVEIEEYNGHFIHIRQDLRIQNATIVAIESSFGVIFVNPYLINCYAAHEQLQPGAVFGRNLTILMPHVTCSKHSKMHLVIGCWCVGISSAFVIPKVSMAILGALKPSINYFFYS